MKRTRITQSAHVLRNLKQTSAKRAATASVGGKNITCEYSKNINEYVHVLKDPRTNEQGLEWLLQLRKRATTQLKTPKEDKVPSVYYRAPESKEKKLVTDVSYRGNSLDIVHLMNKRNGETPTLSQVGFEVGLRSYKPKVATAKEGKFNLIPYHYKKDRPVEFLPPMRPTSATRMSRMPFIQKSKVLSIKGAKSGVELINSFEGPQAYPLYKDKLKDANYNNTRHLLTKNCRMSTALWQTGLRSYDSTHH